MTRNFLSVQNGVNIAQTASVTGTSAGDLRTDPNDGDLKFRDASSESKIVSVNNIAAALAASSATTDVLSEGSSNLYFTNERAQDAVGNIFTDSATVDFTYDDDGNTVSASVLPTGVDHNALANLTAGDVHTQYAKLTGRSGGQTLNGGTASGENLTIDSTTHGVKGKVKVGTNFAFDQTLKYFGVGLVAPLNTIHTYRTDDVNNVTYIEQDADTGTPKVTLGRSRAGNFNLADGDTIGMFQWEGCVSSVKRYLSSISSIYRGSGTSRVSDIAFSVASGSSVFEAMRLSNGGNLGIGVTAPLFGVHVSGTDSKTNVQLDCSDTAGWTPSLSFNRIYGYGGGNVANEDTLGEVGWSGTVGSNEQLLGRLHTYYTGNGTTKYSDMVFWLCNNSDTAEVARLTGAGKLGLNIGAPGIPNTYLDVGGDIATRLGADNSSSGSMTDVSTLGTSFVRFTNNAGGTIHGLANPFNGKEFVFVNAGSGTFTITNESGTEATAANRIITGTGADISIVSTASIKLKYDSTSARWRVIGGSGSSDTFIRTLVTSNYTLLAADAYLAVDTTSGQVQITMPDPSSSPNRVVTIKKISADINNVLIDALSGILFDRGTSYTLSNQWQSVTLVSDSDNNWEII